MLVAFFSVAQANDGVYFMQGNFLVPTKETDISVKKEILTITIGKDSLATVDVYYQFMNNGDAKTVTMAFEASAPYNAMQKFQRNGVHPYIKDFTVTMNDQPLSYSNRVVAIPFVNGTRKVDFTPLDLSKWKGWGEISDDKLPMDDAIYNAETDSTMTFAYGYFFTAPFKAGLNIVHHTYSFMMSYHGKSKFDIPYWLTPATRWANHQVDDFTLRIKSESPVRDFCMADTVFAEAPFKVVGGSGEFSQMNLISGEHYLYASLMPDATLEWHTTNFCPKSEMRIEDASAITEIQCNEGQVVIDANGTEYRYVGDCGDTYFVSSQENVEIPKKGCTIEVRSVDNGKGWTYPRECGTYNVRKTPSLSGAVIGKIKYEQGMLPDVYRCLGHVQVSERGNHSWWYKIQFGNSIGYVCSDYMTWDTVCTY